jgi:uncharacterized protein YkvS
MRQESTMTLRKFEEDFSEYSIEKLEKQIDELIGLEEKLVKRSLVIMTMVAEIMEEMDGDTKAIEKIFDSAGKSIAIDVQNLNTLKNVIIESIEKTEIAGVSMDQTALSNKGLIEYSIQTPTRDIHFMYLDIYERFDSLSFADFKNILGF